MKPARVRSATWQKNYNTGFEMPQAFKKKCWVTPQENQDNYGIDVNKFLTHQE